MSILFTFPKFVSEIPAAGMSLARCCSVVDMGTVVSKNFGSSSRQFFWEFELPTKLATVGSAAGTPLKINRRFSMSLGKKSGFRKIMEAWCGRSLESDEAQTSLASNLYMFPGKAALLNIIHNEEYANIENINPLLEGTKCPPAHYAPVFFIMNADLWNPTAAQIAAFSVKMSYPNPRNPAQPIVKMSPIGETFAKYGAMSVVYKKLPEWMQKEIAKSPEYQAVISGQAVSGPTAGDAQPDAPTENQDGPPADDDNIPF